MAYSAGSTISEVSDTGKLGPILFYITFSIMVLNIWVSIFTVFAFSDY